MSQAPSRPLSLRVTEGTALVLCPILFAACFFLSAEMLLRRDLGALILLGGAAGWAAADVVSGLAHWGFDRYGSETTPLLGPHFVQPFREHHRDPKAMTRHGFLETNGNNAIGGTAAGVVFLAVFWFFGRESAAVSCVVLWLTSTSIWALPANQVHKWAHESRPPAPIRLLQKLRVVLPPTRHEVHHRPPHLLHYCIAHGNLNRFLDRIRFFATIEKGLAWLGAHTAVEDAPSSETSDAPNSMQRSA